MHRDNLIDCQETKIVKFENAIFKKHYNRFEKRLTKTKKKTKSNMNENKQIDNAI